MNKRLQLREETFGLTPRELQVIAALSSDATNKGNGEEFLISEDTVTRQSDQHFQQVESLSLNGPLRRGHPKHQQQRSTGHALLLIALFGVRQGQGYGEPGAMVIGAGGAADLDYSAKLFDNAA